MDKLKYHRTLNRNIQHFIFPVLSQPFRVVFTKFYLNSDSYILETG